MSQIICLKDDLAFLLIRAIKHSRFSIGVFYKISRVADTAVDSTAEKTIISATLVKAMAYRAMPLWA